MGTFLVAVIAAFASGLVLLALLGRYNERGCLADWEEVLTPAGRQRYDALRERFERELAASRFTYERARAAVQRGDREAAARLLDAGREYVVGLAPDRELLLQEMGRYTRMLAAVAPLPPLRPSQFQLGRLAALAGVGWLGHHFLVSAPERLRLRLRILRTARAMVVRMLPGAGGGAKAGSGTAFDWGRIDAAHTDWSTLDRESLASFGSLVATLPGTI